VPPGVRIPPNVAQRRGRRSCAHTSCVNLKLVSQTQHGLRRVTTLLLFGCLVCSALIVTAAALATSEVTKTKVVVYSPFTINGTLSNGVNVIRTVSGSCWEASISSVRPDAWRCTSGNEIFDPCYSGTAKSVACPRSWSGDRVVRLVLTKRLPVNANPPLNTNKSDPLRIALANGVRCGFSGGATGTVAGHRLNYYCTNRAWLVGSPNRRSQLWTILYLSSLKSSTSRSVAITTAWY
jgi:hypothetical protein